MEHFESWPLLAATTSPKQLKELPSAKLPALAAEIRDHLVHRVGENGGHLASNLGAVELTMAIHRVFDAPRDHIVFDVGHQSYTHKLLTERGARFDTLRLPGGLSGFPKREESAYDAFGTGHASTAISAAVGLAEADRLAGRDAWTVAVVGDGALTGGLSFEGLNNCHSALKLIIVINENEMSISPNTGRLAKQLSRMRASRGYIRTKEVSARVLQAIPLIGRPIYRGLRRVKRHVKHAFYRENMFEHMGIRYLGPIDGNDVAATESMLRHAKHTGGCAILHVKTVKGKGYAPAEQDAAHYHALPPKGVAPVGETFSAVMGDTLCALAEEKENVVAITAAMRDGTGLSSFAARYPDRFFDVGIAEGHAVTFAAGLAAGGAHPVVAVYSTFLQRAYDNLVHDAALQRLPLTLCIDRAGLNAQDGATHHGVLDVAMLSTLPQVRIYTPTTAHTLFLALADALTRDGITAVRYPSGAPDEEIARAFYGTLPDSVGVRAKDFGKAPRVTIVTHGRIVSEALRAAHSLAREGMDTRILLCEYIAPYDALAAELLPMLAGEHVLFLEEEIRAGGFGMHVSCALRGAGDTRTHHVMATKDAFLTLCEGETLYGAAGLDAAHIQATVQQIIEGETIC